MSATKTKQSSSTKELKLDGHSLTMAQVEAVAQGKLKVALSAAAQKQIDQSRAIVEHFLAKRTVVYGITTGFGKFKDVFIPPEQTEQLQRNFLASPDWRAIFYGPTAAVFVRRGPWGWMHAERPEIERAHLRLESLLDLPDALAPL